MSFYRLAAILKIQGLVFIYIIICDAFILCTVISLFWWQDIQSSIASVCLRTHNKHMTFVLVSRLNSDKKYWIPILSDFVSKYINEKKRKKTPFVFFQNLKLTNIIRVDKKKQIRYYQLHFLQVNYLVRPTFILYIYCISYIMNLIYFSRKFNFGFLK